MPHGCPSVAVTLLSKPRAGSSDSRARTQTRTATGPGSQGRGPGRGPRGSEHHVGTRRSGDEPVRPADRPLAAPRIRGRGRPSGAVTPRSAARPPFPEPRTMGAECRALSRLTDRPRPLWWEQPGTGNGSPGPCWERPGTGNGPAPIPRALGAEAGRSHTTCCAQQEGMNRACDGTDGGWQRPGTVRTARLQPRDHTRT